MKMRPSEEEKKQPYTKGMFSEYKGTSNNDEPKVTTISMVEEDEVEEEPNQKNTKTSTSDLVSD